MCGDAPQSVTAQLMPPSHWLAHDSVHVPPPAVQLLWQHVPCAHVHLRQFLLVRVSTTKRPLAMWAGVYKQEKQLAHVCQRPVITPCIS